MKEEVQDKFGIAWFIFVLLGTATLLPLNVFFTEKEFYDVRFQVHPYNIFVVDNFMSLFALCFNTANLLTLGLLIFYQKYMSVRALVLQPLVITLLMLGSTAALALRTDLDGDLMAKFTLPSLGLMGMCTALLQGGTLQLASLFSTVHILGLCFGIAIGGLATSLLSFFSQLRATSSGEVPSPEDISPAAFLYFSASAVVIVCCIIGYWSLFFIPYGRYKFRLAGILTEPLDAKLQSDYVMPLITRVANDPDAAGTSSQTSGGATRTAIVVVETVSIDPHPPEAPFFKRHAFTFYCVALFNCLAVTFAVHPGISSFVCPINNPAVTSPCTPRPPDGRLWGDLFVPLLYVVFNVGDFVGRMLSSIGPWSKGTPNSFYLLIYSILRAVPGVAICFTHVVSPTPWQLPLLIDNDSISLALVGVLGLTQGHLISTVLVNAPTTLGPDERAKYGPVTSFAISAGCFVGSVVSFALMFWLQSHA